MTARPAKLTDEQLDDYLDRVERMYFTRGQAQADEAYLERDAAVAAGREFQQHARQAKNACTHHAQSEARHRVYCLMLCVQQIQVNTGKTAAIAKAERLDRALRHRRDWLIVLAQRFDRLPSFVLRLLRLDLADQIKRQTAAIDCALIDNPVEPR